MSKGLGWLQAGPIGHPSSCTQYFGQSLHRSDGQLFVCIAIGLAVRNLRRRHSHLLRHSQTLQVEKAGFWENKFGHSNKIRDEKNDDEESSCCMQ